MPFTGGRGWGGFFPGSLLSVLISGLIIVLIVYLVIRLFKSHTFGFQGSSKDRSDSEAILKARFAKGEISREEFARMKEILSEK